MVGRLRQNLPDHDPHKLLLPRAQQEFRGFTESNLLARILDARSIDLHAALLDQPLGLAFRSRQFQLHK